MDSVVDTQPKLVEITRPGIQEAWQMILSQLRMEMKRADYETWVAPLQPLGFNEGLYRVGAHNSYALDWVESRLRSRITGLLEAALGQKINLRFSLIGSPSHRQAELQSTAPLNGATLTPEQVEKLPVVDDGGVTQTTDTPAAESAPAKTNGKKKTAAAKEKAPSDGEGSPRKIQLQRAYGTERARVIQPERGMFLTMYLFQQWLPLLGHSAFAAILAARSMCYWNPMTGELRNVIETDMAELAKRADVSVRTMKEVLNNDLVKKYFLRYKVRRLMTPNGVRTAGILLQVRMDDPLTPEDQVKHTLTEEEHWYTVDFEDETDED